MGSSDLPVCAAATDNEQNAPEEFQQPSLQTLPTELQLIILRHAMPSRVIPVLKSSDTFPLHPLKNLPQNLLAVSKSIAANARSVIDREIYFVFDLDRCCWTMDQVNEARDFPVMDCDFFAKTQLVDQAQHIQRMRRFEVVLGARQFQSWGFLDDESLNGGDVSKERQLYKEKLRMICDAFKR